MGGFESYNMLMTVNQAQEKAIKQLFQKKSWNFMYKVLPPSCDYLWGLYEHDERPKETTEYQSSAHIKKTEQKKDDGTLVQGPNVKNNDLLGNINYVSVETALNKTDWAQEKEHEKEIRKPEVVTANDEKFLDGKNTPINSDTEDYNSDSNSLKEKQTCPMNENEFEEQIGLPVKKKKTYTKPKSIRKAKCLNQTVVNNENESAVCSKLKIKKSIDSNKTTTEPQEKRTETSKRCENCNKVLFKRNGQTFCRFCREKCSFCDKSFPRTLTGQKRLVIHLRWHKAQRPFECSECSKTFTSQEYLLRHKGRKHNPDPSYDACAVCLKSFTKDALKSHMINMHGARTTPFQCDICGNCFRYKGSLKQHKLSVHAEKRTFFCDICSSSFTTSHNLRLHRVRHEADQKAVCTMCGKTLQGWSGLREHMRRHANQRQYQCGKCPKSFYTKQDLVNHFKIHTGEKPFKCHLCTYACAIKGNLTKHMKKHRSGDNIPEHKYKGHCKVNKNSENIKKIDYKKVDFLSESTDTNSVLHGLRENVDTTGIVTGHCQSKSGHASTHAQEESDFVVSDSKSEFKSPRVLEYEENKYILSSNNLNACSTSNLGTRKQGTRTSTSSLTESRNPEPVSLICDNSIKSSHTLDMNAQSSYPVASVHSANYSLPTTVPVLNKDNQILNQERTNSLYNNSLHYYS